MDRFDMHIHMMANEQHPAGFLAKLAEASVSQAAVFSQPPPQYDAALGAPFEARLERLLSLCAAGDGKLLPVLWLHPAEEDAAAIAKCAAAKGVRGFKIICNNFHVYEDFSMALLGEIAALGLPVCFHSGILWDKAPSSKYNRPLDFEYLIEVPRLRFSLAHCAWPWTDECLALYGKFLTVGQENPETAAEMFFDLTPGTPLIYRRDLLTKLLTVGYDTTHNMMFGTDCRAESYNAAWTKEWLARDDGIYDELGTPNDVRERIYSENARRFFGLVDVTVRHKRLSMDGTAV